MVICVLFLILSSNAIDLRNQSLRLQGGETNNEGRLEVSYNDTWHGVCSKSMTDTTARYICNMLGYSNGMTLLKLKEFNASSSYVIDELECAAGACKECSFSQYGQYNCSEESRVELACGDLTDCSDITDGQYQRTACMLAGNEVILCPGSNSSVYRVWGTDDCYFSNICEGEASHYQACGCPGVLIEDKICKSSRCLGRDGYMTAVATKWMCDGYFDCIDRSDEPDCYEPTAITCTPTSDWQSPFVVSRYHCDSQNDCKHGEDEIHCGHKIGLYCQMSGHPGWADESFICDNETQCDDGVDEVGCDWSTVDTCSGQEGEVVELNQYQICQYPNMTFVDGACEGYIDQMNCSFTNALTCTVLNFINTRVRQNWTCQSFEMCDDAYDDDCVTYIDKCQVHKLAECDNVTDCQSGADEYPYNPRCNNTTPVTTCQRRFQRDGPHKLPIPLAWLCDGVQDCVDGEDEDLANWNVCGEGDKRVCLPKSYPDCNQGFQCPDKVGTTVAFDSVCDYEESCGGSETELCSLTKSLPDIITEVIQYDDDLFVPPCIPGLLNDEQFDCDTEDANSTSSLVPPTTIHMMREKVSCKSRFGEQYLMLASHQRCIEPEAVSGLTLASDSNCSGPNIVITLSENKAKKLLYTPATDASPERYLEHVFVCKNQKCITPDKFCNLYDDCGDGSDEDDCANSFKCRAGSPKFIRADQMCNAQHDCFDGSDECNPECQKENIIDGPILKIAAVIIGLASTFINIYMIGKGIVNRSRLDKRVPFTNQIFVSLIAVGDFCVGIYLLNIVIIDYLYRDNYCEEKYEWLTSPHCSFLGVLTTFGSQLSLFSMVGLSAYRAASMKNIFGKSHVNIKYSIYIFLISAVLILVAMLIAMVPILDVTEDYFTNGMYYKNNTMFNKIATLDTHRKFINMYSKYGQNATNETYSWSEIRTHFENQVFTKNYPGVIGKNLKFYGNAGVCLFKWFVNSDDSQRHFTLCVISLNLMCFLIITGCYGHIIFATQKSQKELSRSKIDEKRSKKLQTKISLIIISDFLCWIPFCLICVLHTLGVIDAYRYYQVSSIILIPINSCINPIIYSNATSTIWSALRRRVNKNDNLRRDTTRVISLRTLNYARSQFKQPSTNSTHPIMNNTMTDTPPNRGSVSVTGNPAGVVSNTNGSTFNSSLYTTVTAVASPTLSHLHGVVLKSSNNPDPTPPSMMSSNSEQSCES